MKAGRFLVTLAVGGTILYLFGSFGCLCTKHCTLANDGFAKVIVETVIRPLDRIFTGQ